MCVNMIKNGGSGTLRLPCQMRKVRGGWALPRYHLLLFTNPVISRVQCLNLMAPKLVRKPSQPSQGGNYSKRERKPTKPLIDEEDMPQVLRGPKKVKANPTSTTVTSSITASSTTASSTTTTTRKKKEKDGDTMQMITAQPPRGHEYRSGLWRDPCGSIINYDVEGVCAGCNGARNDEVDETGEITLLCDGNYCSREYHLKCAGLTAVPDAEFLCPQCCMMGTSKTLNDYFERVESERR